MIKRHQIVVLGNKVSDFLPVKSAILPDIVLGLTLVKKLVIFKMTIKLVTDVKHGKDN